MRDARTDALYDEYTELVAALEAVDNRFRSHLGDVEDMLRGAGVHRAEDDLDRESAELDAEEQRILGRLETVCAAIRRTGGSAPLPGPRESGPSGPYFGFQRGHR